MKSIYRVFLITAFLSSGFVTVAAAMPAQKAIAKPSDSDLSDRINHRLDTSTLVHKYDIHVDVNAGVATLTGKVATAAQKTEAARLAHIAGVTRVDNKLTVDPDEDKTLMDKAKAGVSKTGEAITDTWITTKVHYHFLGEDLLKGSDINVDTKDHVVTLKGTVKSAAGRARATALAKQTDGVTRVIDQLTISNKR